MPRRKSDARSERAVGVTDSRAERERVGRAAVGRARQRHGQVGHQRETGRATGSAQGDQAVVDGGECRSPYRVVCLHRVTLRQPITHDGQGAAAVAGRRECPRRDPHAGGGGGQALWRAADEDGPGDLAGPRVDAVECRVELIADP